MGKLLDEDPEGITETKGLVPVVGGEASGQIRSRSRSRRTFIGPNLVAESLVVKIQSRRLPVGMAMG